MDFIPSSFDKQAKRQKIEAALWWGFTHEEIAEEYNATLLRVFQIEHRMYERAKKVEKQCHRWALGNGFYMRCMHCDLVVSLPTSGEHLIEEVVDYGGRYNTIYVKGLEGKILDFCGMK